MKRSHFGLILVSLLLAGCSHFPASPRPGKPIVYPQALYPEEVWQGKSTTGRDLFVSIPGEDGYVIAWDEPHLPLKGIVGHHTVLPDVEPLNVEERAVWQGCLCEMTGKTDAPDLSTAEGKSVFEHCLSEYEKHRVYEPLFLNPKYTTPFVFGLPVHSGHVIQGKGEVFDAYTFLVYPDGHVSVRLVLPREVGGVFYMEMIGWQAGNWKVNTETLGLAFVGNFENGSLPTPAALKAARSIWNYYRRRIPSFTFKTHREVRSPKLAPTVCPGPAVIEWIRQLK